MDKWFISRNHTLTVWGEYEPVNSWEGYRTLNDVVKYKIYISGKNKTNSFGCKPYRWRSELLYNNGSLGYRVPSTHPSCKSINDACYQADRFLTPEILDNALRHFTSRSKVTCIVTDDLQPYFTSFGNPNWSAYFPNTHKRHYKNGKYHTAYKNWDGTVRFNSYELFFGGYAGGGSKVSFNHWLFE